jgi:hypothetical protein
MAGTERAGEIAAEFVRLKVIFLSRLELHRSLRQPMKLLDSRRRAVMDQHWQSRSP